MPGIGAAKLTRFFWTRCASRSADFVEVPNKCQVSDQRTGATKFSNDPSGQLAYSALLLDNGERRNGANLVY